MPLTEDGIEAKPQIIPFEVQATPKEEEKSDGDTIEDKLSSLLQKGEISIDINESEWSRSDEHPRIKDLPVRLSYTGEEKGDDSEM